MAAGAQDGRDILLDLSIMALQFRTGMFGGKTMFGRQVVGWIRLPMIFAVTIAMASTASGADYYKGLQYYYAGDFAAALDEWLPLAEQGSGPAQTKLAIMYDLGEGVVRDQSEAAKWYRKASLQGDAKAQMNLGFMYLFGEGVPQDNVAAYMWLEISARFGADEAADERVIIAQNMTRAAITRAQNAAQKCLESEFMNCAP